MKTIALLLALLVASLAYAVSMEELTADQKDEVLDRFKQGWKKHWTFNCVIATFDAPGYRVYAQDDAIVKQVYNRCYVAAEAAYKKEFNYNGRV